MEYVDETAAKITLAVRPGDSIRRISGKIDGSYSWVYEWIERLEGAGILRRDDGVYVENYEVRDRYRDVVAALSRSIPPSIDDGYVIPHFAGMPFAYTKIDGVYVWTHGGYQIARGHDDYPIFLRVTDRDLQRWTAFFDEFGVPHSVEDRLDSSEHDGTVSYVLFPTTGDLTREWVDGNPVVPLEETIDHMMRYRVNYEPALEMIADEYDREIDASHEDPRVNA
ncbi:helix-turn-helix domain-containing protein [Halalkaliarchaeum sp. AArc-CO]|uniref:helix-turn-helix domain-containing protein n=1 Tax=Halalkaliarchaeum sp. AArc-CO TaxID=2866381 RepID=UPI00217DFA0F|nr:helix-turn-helix domain-containing protein [Halalkaliarchaeum sp. AArc-CO]